MASAPSTPSPPASGIVARDLSRTFSGRPALSGVSFVLPAGSLTALLGPNGAGKSTLLQILAGLLAPSAGSAFLAGHDTFLASRHLRATVGYLPETCPLYGEMRVEEYLKYRASLFSLPRRALPSRLRRVLAACGLAEHARSVVHRLPLGIRQRVGIAAAVLHEPRFLLLDEPFRGVDPAAARGVASLLRGLAADKGATVLFATHDLAAASALADRVLLLSAGSVAARGVASLLRALARDKGATVLFATHDLAAASALADRVLLLSAGSVAADATLAEFTRGGALSDAYLAATAPALASAP